MVYLIIVIYSFIYLFNYYLFYISYIFSWSLRVFPGCQYDLSECHHPYGLRRHKEPPYGHLDL